MSAKTKILVMKKRELIYTILFAVLVLILAVLLILMFAGKTGNETSKNTQEQIARITSADTGYIPGVYTTPVTLGSSSVDVEVTVDKDHINGIRLVNLSESAATMYPLMTPALEDIAAQICQTQSLENISCSRDNRYTVQTLLNAVSEALSSAQMENWN